MLTTCEHVLYENFMYEIFTACSICKVSNLISRLYSGVKVWCEIPRVSLLGHSEQESYQRFIKWYQGFVRKVIE